jgi:hypothetical protein
MICAKGEDAALGLHQKIDANFLGASNSAPTPAPAPITFHLKPDLQVGMAAWTDRLFIFSYVPTKLTGAVLYQLPYSLGDGTVITFDFSGKEAGTLYVIMRTDFDGGLKSMLLQNEEWQTEGRMPAYLDDGHEEFRMLSMKTSTGVNKYTLPALEAKDKEASVVFAWKPNVGAASVASAPLIEVVTNSYLKSTSLWLAEKHTSLTKAFADLTAHCDQAWSLSDWVYSFYNKFPPSSRKRCVSFVSASKTGFRMRFSDRPDKDMKSNSAFYELDVTPTAATLSRFASQTAGGDGTIKPLKTSPIGASYSNEDLFSSHYLCLEKKALGTSSGWSIVYGSAGTIAFTTDDLFSDGDKLQSFDPTMFAFAAQSGRAEITNIQLIIDPSIDRYCKLLGMKASSETNSFYVDTVSPSFADHTKTWLGKDVLVSGSGFSAAVGCLKYVCKWTRSGQAVGETLLVDATVVAGVSGRAITCPGPSSEYTQTCVCADTNTHTTHNKCAERCAIDSNFKCTECTAGKYKSWGTGFGPSACIACVEGEFQPLADISSCVPCARGHYASGTGSTVCIKCVEGKFGTAVVASGRSSEASSCTVCPVSKFQSSEAQADCQQCGDGKFQDQTGQTACLDCPTGYNLPSASDMTSCINCLAGKYASHIATRDCQICPRGKYSEVITSVACKNCPRGLHGLNPAAGSSRSQLSLSCQACPIASTATTSRWIKMRAIPARQVDTLV